MADDLAARLHATTDAQVWTDEFMALVNTGIDIDWDLMIGWFANAIETGRAAGRVQQFDGGECFSSEGICPQHGVTHIDGCMSDSVTEADMP